MTDKDTIRISRFLSLILRHEPEKVGLKLDEAGWVGVDDLLQAVNRHGRTLSLDQLRRVVAHNNKQRFAFNEDGTHIRASQGHSVDIDLQYAPQPPPEILFHAKDRLQILCRSKQGCLTECWSEDNGKNWGPMQRTALPNPRRQMV